MRQAKGTMRLTTLRLAHRVELRFKATVDGVTLELHRDDCKPGPVVTLRTDEARAALRALQAASDEAYRRERLRAKTDRELEHTLSRLASIGGERC